LKVNPQYALYRPAAAPQPAHSVAPQAAAKTSSISKADAPNSARLSAEAKLRQAIEQSQPLVQEATNDLPRLLELGKLLDLRA
jgi:hypothetical protein